MRLLYLLQISLITVVLVKPTIGSPETVKRSRFKEHLVGDSHGKAVDCKSNTKFNRIDNKSSCPQEKDSPSLNDIGLSLGSNELAKRNELDSVTVQPWTPGRGAVGVKLEVTW